MPPDGRERAVEIGRRDRRVQHHGGRRPQEMIECVADLVGREFLDEIEMRDLPKRARPHPCGPRR